MWSINNRGFLGTNDPLISLITNKEKHIPAATRLENIISVLPYWIEERKIREELVHNLREVSSLIDEDFLLGQDEEKTERLMHIYSYMASSYVFARTETPATRIPAEIAVPLTMVANKLGRKPILSYASYCLTNWERIDREEPIELGNIKLLSNFCPPTSGKSDEDWFILVHVDIEQAAADGVSACKQLLENPWQANEVHNITTANDMLTKLYVSLAKMNKTMARMPEECSPDNYFRWVRPYIFSFNQMVYEGCFDNKPITCRGETGAQSSIVPAFLAALGIKHQDSMLTHHLMEMRDYMPSEHRQFLSNLEEQAANTSSEGVGLRNLALKDDVLKEIYNQCVEEIIAFRNKHFEYAVNYISKKVENPSGTGGTPYIPWLKQLREETESLLIP
jgi:indoleamine 2,3-dioxygenase